MSNEKTVQHWYLVCWSAKGGVAGSTEIWYDHPWRVGIMREALRTIETANPGVRGVVLTSVTPIDPAGQKNEIADERAVLAEKLPLERMGECLDRKPDNLAPTADYVAWAEELAVLADKAIEHSRLEVLKQENPETQIYEQPLPWMSYPDAEELGKRWMEFLKKNRGTINRILGT